MTDSTPDPARPNPIPGTINSHDREMLERCTRCLRLRGSCRPSAATCDERVALPQAPDGADDERRRAA